MIDLDEIRKDNEWSKKHDALPRNECDCSAHDTNAYANIDALLAEVERLTIKNNFYSVAITEKIADVERLNRRIELLGGISSAPEAGP